MTDLRHFIKSITVCADDNLAVFFGFSAVNRRGVTIESGFPEEIFNKETGT